MLEQRQPDLRRVGFVEGRLGLGLGLGESSGRAAPRVLYTSTLWLTTHYGSLGPSLVLVLL